MALLLIRRVVGESMAPALKPGRLIIASGLRRGLHAGQVVVIRHKGMEKIKRIARMEHGELYVVGDNAAVSTDSRHFGWLPLAAVEGRVVWPRV